jgi:hypothetical protein
VAATRSRTCASSLAVIGLMTVGPRTGHGQRIPTPAQPLFPPSTMSQSADRQRLTWRWPADSSQAPRTHWLEGAIIGGVTIGFLGAVTGVGLCHFDDPCDNPAPFAIGGFLLGALAGVGLGGHIGEAFPK